MTTIHSYTTDQRLLDNSHKDLEELEALQMQWFQRAQVLQNL